MDVESNLNKETRLLEASFDGVFESSAEASLNKDLNIDSNLRVKTSLRMVYEAQAEVIRRQIGELEEVREKFGLNARKICQLLMVDPSAWNRWTRPGNTAPPHIWRALQWYSIVNEKIPGLTPQYFTERIVPRVDRRTNEWVETLGKQTQDLSQDLIRLQSESQRLLSTVESQVELLETQKKQIRRLKFSLIVGLSLCFGLVLGLLLAVRSSVL